MIEIAQVEAIGAWVVWAGLAVGLVFGASMQTGRFCTLGALSDWVLMGNNSRMRLWAWALAVAIGLTQIAISQGLLQDSQSFYTSSRLLWLSHIFGGICFGFGMALASGCGSRTLVRLGEGSLKALVVFLVMALASFMTIRGITGVARSQTIEQVFISLPSRQDLSSLLAYLLNTQADTIRGVVTGVVVAAMAWFVFFKGPRLSARGLLTSTLVGGCVAAGWLATGWLGFIEEHPNTLEPAYLMTNTRGPESLTFVAPLAYSLEILLYWSDRSQVMTFSIATVLGTVLGAGIAAVVSKRFQWQGFASTEDLAQHLIGASLMGIGGVVALGCTIGHGLSGLSLLALGSLISVASILVGGWFGLRFLERGS
ncbi:MAG: hypothetical protein RLZZ344_1089 [Pseudomonadota bacterium]|jgi:uncharacterized membrane protein YedE/YeeE